METSSSDDSLPANKDLIWDVGATHYRERATRFVRQFENRLCVFSNSVEQLYTNYSMYLPEDQERNLIIIPDPYAFHDTFHHVERECVSQTSLYIIPGEVVKRPGLFIMMPSKNSAQKPKLLPLSQVLKLFIQHRPADDPFLPVLVKGDLKPFNKHLPCLRLHRLEPNKITRMSEFSRKDLRNAIVSRLEELQEYAQGLQ
ncbi:MAG: hypothetical protein MI864_05570 [Pseudomonadales bacterium]|uniref:Uncharacterized protein n=1 Tax=Oleiphilus messinensis TaxID=141451 RepID=A0A1Y0IHR6_9GAMM|nr:hypothetical protein [Oleiphilus messinensis]ARU59396.1 hypothetical protein OLMES_5416 [Oleiphilus messinensis]MCG8609986.1 hypothetical protein [Pseudomonadales bacterium]